MQDVHKIIKNLYVIHTIRASLSEPHNDVPYLLSRVCGGICAVHLADQIFTGDLCLADLVFTVST